MSFGGYNPSGSSELPFTTGGGVPAAMRSRTSSFSSVHSNQGYGGGGPPTAAGGGGSGNGNQSPYASQPGSPGGPNYNNNNNNTGLNINTGYFGEQQHHQQQQQQQQQPGYGSSAPGSPASASSSYCPTPPLPNQQPQHGHQHHHSIGSLNGLNGHQGGGDRSGYSSGYDSPTGISSSIPFNRMTVKTTAAGNRTGVGADYMGAGQYSPGLSSADSSRRNSVSGDGHRPHHNTFRPPNSLIDEDDYDDKLGHGGGRSGKKKKGAKKGSGFLPNDWDLLLPTKDPYEDEDDDDEGLNDHEKWKKRQLKKRGWESKKGQAIILSLIMIVAVFVRIWKLAVPGAVVFDEQHFGAFAVDYLRREFFMDVHPPLGKMLYAAVGYLLGFDGQFSFYLGRLYTKNVPYVGMRLFSAVCGIGLVPISYFTVKRSGHSTLAAIVMAVLVTFENALITQSRFILLDGPMMLFMGYTLLSWTNFYNHRNRPFTRGWWTWLLQTGFGLFLSFSVKWVGLFTITTIGLCVFRYLSESRQHLYLSMRDFSKQFLALGICLLLLPSLMYIGLFALDFKILTKSGPGNAWVSPSFQMTLSGHDVVPVMADIGWESKVHIRHENTNGGWIHSMRGEYTRPGVKDQAIQLVEWDDDLTCWQVLPVDMKLQQENLEKVINKQQQGSDGDEKRVFPKSFKGYVYDGDLIRLKHCFSRVALSTSELNSVGSNKTFLKEVKGMNWLEGAVNMEEAVWRVELVQEASSLLLRRPESGRLEDLGATNTDKGVPPVGESAPPAAAEGDAAATAGTGGSTAGSAAASVPKAAEEKAQWHAIHGFRLYNEKFGCYLQSHKVPRTAYSTYQEVGCIQGGRQKANTVFNVDQNVNLALPADTNSTSYQPLSFFQKFIELNRVMWWTHHELTTNTISTSTQNKNAWTDESHPLSWPLLSRGLNYFSSRETNQYIHFMGNPLTWWISLLSIMVYGFSILFSVIRYLRKSPTTITNERDRFGLTPFYAVASGTFFLGWGLHFAPFFFMDRQLYLHHYLPSLYFSILLAVTTLDRTWQKWPKKIRQMTGLVWILLTVLSWYSYSPLSYGNEFSSKELCERVRSVGGWEFLCDRKMLAFARPTHRKRHQAATGVTEGGGVGEAEKRDGTASVPDPEEEDEDYEEDDDYEEEEGDDEGEGAPHTEEGPFKSEDEKHYNHEHFKHPPTPVPVPDQVVMNAAKIQQEQEQQQQRLQEEEAQKRRQQEEAAAQLAAQRAQEEQQAKQAAEEQEASRRAAEESMLREQREQQEREERERQHREQQEREERERQAAETERARIAAEEVERQRKVQELLEAEQKRQQQEEEEERRRQQEAVAAAAAEVARLKADAEARIQAEVQRVLSEERERQEREKQEQEQRQREEQERQQQQQQQQVQQEQQNQEELVRLQLEEQIRQLQAQVELNRLKHEQEQAQQQ